MDNRNTMATRAGATRRAGTKALGTLVALAGLACHAAQAAQATQWWGHAGIGWGQVGLGSTPAVPHASGSGVTVDLGGGIVLAHRWQLGVDLGTLVQQTTFCGYYCTSDQLQHNREFDHYLLTLRYAPSGPASRWYFYGSGGQFEYLDGRTQGAPGPGTSEALARQGKGTGGEIGIGYVLGARGDARRLRYVVRLSQSAGHIRPDDGASASYSMAATQLALGAEFW